MWQRGYAAHKVHGKVCICAHLQVHCVTGN
jgi:hypothetical protein